MTELGDLLAGAGYSSGDVVPLHSVATQGTSSTSSTSFTRVEVSWGFLLLASIPQDAVRYRYVCYMENDTSNETTTSRPELQNESMNTTPITECEVSVTSTSPTFADSGWEDPSSITPTESFRVRAFQAKVSVGTSTGTLHSPTLIAGVSI